MPSFHMLLGSDGWGESGLARKPGKVRLATWGASNEEPHQGKAHAPRLSCSSARTRISAANKVLEVPSSTLDRGCAVGPTNAPGAVVWSWLGGLTLIHRPT